MATRLETHWTYDCESDESADQSNAARVAWGYWGARQLNNGTPYYADFSVPADFLSLHSAVVVIIADTTETVQWDVYAGVGHAGDNYDADDRSALDNQQAVTQNQLAELDISNVLTNLSPVDYGGIGFVSNTATLNVIGIRLVFTCILNPELPT